MPRQSRGRAAPSRHAPAPAQSRSASTSSRNVPATQQVPPPAVAAQQSGPGMLGNIASTAAGVGMGSVIGHGLSNMLFGGSSSQQQQPEAAPQQQQSMPQDYQQQNGMSAYDNYNNGGQQQQMGISCEGDAKQFTQCLEQTKGDMSACSYYLEQLKQCQAMARHA